MIFSVLDIEKSDANCYSNCATDRKVADEPNTLCQVSLRLFISTQNGRQHLLAYQVEFTVRAKPEEDRRLKREKRSGQVERQDDRTWRFWVRDEEIFLA